MASPDLPLISCIMPTYNRRNFIPHAIRYFMAQDYENKELIILDDGEDRIEDLIPDIPNIHYYPLEKKITLGAKLNLACKYAKGNLIANWDDDDWYADWRLKYQAESLMNSGAQVCGINKLLYLDLRDKNTFQYVYPKEQRVWLLGSSLFYKKELWNINRFADINVGMDGLFVWKTKPENVLVLGDNRFSVHMVHRNNISPKDVSGSWWHAHPPEEIMDLMGEDWQYYNNGQIHYPKLNGYPTFKRAGTPSITRLKNVYACLVHEKEECIADLVKNLRYQDADSTILLYNGSKNPDLLKSLLPFQDAGVVLHPHPESVRHGYLHSYALNCMRFALEHLNADIITMVDSDQLCIRKGYAEFMSRFFSNVSNIGMLSSSPQRIDSGNKTNPVALQAFREYELWKPFLKQFPEGEEHFVHWTFWPSTVFTKDAARDLLKLLKENAMLQNIMEKSRIWASEEVILPTLVSLLGYEIKSNPCNYELVRYRQPVRQDELRKSLQQPDSFWVHPVERKFDDPIRTFIRKQFSEYTVSASQIPPEEISCPDEFPVAPLLNRIGKIQGWLSDEEAELLIGSSISVMKKLDRPHRIVEIGSYHGKSTIIFGTVVKELFPGARIFSIDPHDGKLGAVDQGLKKFPPSHEHLKKNLADAGLTGNVEIIKSHSYEVDWHLPISYLFIDGLHDYPSVSRDFNHFENFLVTGAFIAFHDYVDYFPGVKLFVDQLTRTGKYSRIHQVQSLVILKKL
jgi:glycosyltransferase involved in cell wall biosynthesis